MSATKAPAVAKAEAKPVSYPLYIGGRWTEPVAGRYEPTINPYDGRPWANVAIGGEEDVNKAVAAARAAFESGPWSTMTGRERSKLLMRVATVLARDAATLAEYETRDNGKLFKEMLGQCQYIPEWFEYFAGAADKIHGEVIPSDKPNYLIYTRQEPIGVVGAIVPWNSPLLLLTWKLAPALAAGCTFIAKPADQTPVSTLELAKRLEEAGVPPGVFNVVTGYGPGAGAALVANPGVDRIAFTGATDTGIRIAQSAATHLARLSLELGGKSPNIVFPDADLDAAVNGVIAGIFAASGQTCIAGSRLLVHKDIATRLVDALAERARTIRLGDPFKPETEMGPVAYKEQMDKVLGYIEVGRQEGADVVVGGHRASGPGLDAGYFVEPTIMRGLNNKDRVASEEIFGPVLTVIEFESEDEAVALANDSRYGLAAGVWTSNIRVAHRVAHRLRAGTVWINSYRVVSFNAPFGGYKMSGVGRENSLQTIREYTETKTVWVELTGATRDPFRLG